MLLIQHIENILGWTLAGLIAFAAPVLADDYQGLPSGDGRDLILENCTACHSTKIILQNYMTRERWDETITWMQKKEGLWELENTIRGKILDYLTGIQGLDSKAALQNTDKPKPHTSRMYRFEYPPNPL